MQHRKIGRNRALVGRHTAVIGTKPIHRKRRDKRRVTDREKGDG